MVYMQECGDYVRSIFVDVLDGLLTPLEEGVKSCWNLFCSSGIQLNSCYLVWSVRILQFYLEILIVLQNCRAGRNHQNFWQNHV